MISNSWIEVDPVLQRVRILENDQPVWEAAVSTSQFGLGEVSGSQCTPRGEFRIAEKIGADAPFGAIFKSRVWTGAVWSSSDPLTEEDLILTRILWLEGVEPSNANTRERYIYFHGTNREDRIGTVASHGCIRLRNTEMIDLFERAEIGMRVVIR